MNKTDVKNIKALLKYRSTVAKGPIFTTGGEMTFEDIGKFSDKDLQKMIKDFEKNSKANYIDELKLLVDAAFKKYGEKGDNMIVLWAANCPERTVYNQDPLEDIIYNNDRNKLYKPICRNWECRGWWDRKDEDPDVLAKWDAKWEEYDKDMNEIRKLLTNLRFQDAESYYRNDNDPLNENWYGVIGIMKDYKVVSFVIRNDGLLCDERGYDWGYNNIIEQL